MRWGAVFGGVALAAVAALPASLLATIPASAADLSLGPPPAPSTYIPAPYFWTGYYVGVAVGYGFGNAPFTDPFVAATSASPSVKGLVAGGVTGINYQIGWAVIGVEADIIGNWVKGDKLDSAFNSLDADIYYTASLTARFGIAFDRLLVYAKWGGALDYDHDTVWENKVGPSLGSTNHAGWTVGGGFEYAMTEHWTGRLEYDFFSFPSKAITFSGAAPSPAAGAVGFNLNQIKLVASYKM